MKIITLDGLKTFLDELLEKIGQEVYSKVESDARFATKDTEEKLQGVRFENISRPDRPLPIIMRVDNPLGVMIKGGPLQGYVSDSDAREKYQPKASLMQDVIDELETDDFDYWKMKFRFDPTEGMTQENCDRLYQPKGDYATKDDLAQLGDGVPSGTWFAPMGPSAWEVPRGVKVVKITWAGKDTYFKVKQGGVIRAMIMSDVFSGGYGDSWTAQRLKFYRAGGTVTDMKDHIPNFREPCQTEFAISWSEEINVRAANVDLTK